MGYCNTATTITAASTSRTCSEYFVLSSDSTLMLMSSKWNKAGKHNSRAIFCRLLSSWPNSCWFGKSQSCDFSPLYPAASQLVLRYVCHLSFIWRFIAVINPLTCRPLFSSEPFVLSYIWDKDAKVLLLSHSLYPELRLNRYYENRTAIWQKYI